MRTQNGFNKVLLVVLGSLLLTLTLNTFALAEGEAVRAIYLSAATVPTNIAGVNTYPDPPRGFNPLAASGAELASYGFPQRPDKQAQPDHYAMWERAMLAAKNRWHGELKRRRNLSGSNPITPALDPATDAMPAVAAQVNNAQASGVILNSGAKTWGSNSFGDLWTTITVPVAQLPFANGGCAANGLYDALTLAGFDGNVYTSPTTGNKLFVPGEFSGVVEDVACNGSVEYENVLGWGWNINTILWGFFLHPGDIFYTEVHAFGGCNNGSAYVEDLTTLVYYTVTILNPCSVAQTGRYANFMVARPPYANDGGNGGGGGVPDELSPLANTIGISFEGAEVLNNSGKAFYPGSQAASTTVLTMVDDTNSQWIEVVSQGSSGFQGLHSLWFQSTGCAYVGGCTP